MVITMGSVTITDKGTITIPPEIRKKYGLNEGVGLEFVESELGIVLVPIKPLKESFGIDGDIMREIAKEIGVDRKRERIHDDNE